MIRNSSSSTWFVTGTDTGCGKTETTVALARALGAGGLRVACFKPIASGCRSVGGRLVNDDALRLIEAMNVDLDYPAVNPVALEPPIAPHIAAGQAGTLIDIDAICQTIERVEADVRLVEGVGGWMVPLGGGRMLEAVPRRLNAGVILVVGMRLGCLNHALLTARAIGADGHALVGWIASFVDPDFAESEANLATLVEQLPAPLLGRLENRRGRPVLDGFDRACLVGQSGAAR